MKKQTENPVIGFLKHHIVPILFTLMCLISIKISGNPISYVLSETMSRLTRNTILIVSLILPVLCGMGLNFSIVLGAMAGEVGLILITHWQIGGIHGMLFAILIATVVAIVLGYLTGLLFNKVKGQEMITGMILGFFAVGVYDLVFLYMLGTIIPMSDPSIMLSATLPDGTTTHIGLCNTINLLDSSKYAFDNLFKMMFLDLLPWLTALLGLLSAAVFAVKKFVKKSTAWQSFKSALPFIISLVLCVVILVLSKTSKAVYSAFFILQVPIFTWLLIALVCFIVIFITKTKLGQDIRTVGTDMGVAAASGINVNRTRIISTIFSTVIAAWGQIVFLQNIGNIQTYNSHEQVGTYAIAAILVGGASIDKATIKQVFIGCILFHVLYFTSPQAGKVLFGDAQLGEYFRIFLCYGIIAVSLMLYAWRKVAAERRRNEEENMIRSSK